MTVPDTRHEAWLHRAVIAVLILAHVASAFFGGSGYDTARDVAEAFGISQARAFPLHGPLFAGSLYLGPVWFYVLALPLAVHPSWLLMAIFATALGSLQFPLAYAAGRRLVDRRFGLLWSSLLALPGWGSFELMGVTHVNVVRTCTLLLLYALVRLAQDRKPMWMVVAGGALALAVHAHPTTAAYAPLVAAIALFALRDVRALIGWGVLSLAVALVPFAPVLIEQAIAHTSLLRQTGSVVESMSGTANLANIPALLHALAAGGPRLIADSFFGAFAPIAQAVIVGIELIAAIGVIAAWRTHRKLIVIGLATSAVVIALVAWMRPSTSYYMTYAMLPPLAALGALGFHRLCALTRSNACFVGSIALLVLLQVAIVAAIAHGISSGAVSMPAITRLDIVHDDSAPPLPEPWLPAHAVDASGALLCSQPQPVILHATYAYLENTYFGLDHRLHCGSRDVRLLGAEPASATHLVGLARWQWQSLGMTPRLIGSLGITGAARVIHPETGYKVPDGTVYPPYARRQENARTLTLEADAPIGEALVVSMPYYIWMPPPALTVQANDEVESPLSRDAISSVFLCRRCAPDRSVRWRIAIESVAPEWIDVVTIALPSRS